MNDQTKSTLRWLVGLPARLVLVLILAGILLVMLMVLVGGLHIQSGFVGESLMRLVILALLVGYTWAVYIGLPFFRKRALWQRILISSVPALALSFLTRLAAAAVISTFLFGESKSDQRVESVSLPSGEVLENHTYYETGFHEGERFNKLSLKNPVTGKSELVGNMDYEAGMEAPSLFSKCPHPQEFQRGDEKVLVISPYVCKRWNWKKEPYWYIERFDTAARNAADYLRSFVKPANSAWFSGSGSGPADYLHYQIENLDLENNVLTVKRIPWDAQVDFPESRDFPDYLVFSAYGYNGQSDYMSTWEFDEARTRAKNGARWEKPMAFRMALDYSVITFPAKAGFRPHGEKRDVALAHDGAKEIAATSLELSDKEVRSAECKYTVFTNTIPDKIEAMYGYASAETNRFFIVWEPRNPASWQTSVSSAMLNLDEWTLISEDWFGRNILREEYVRLRKIEP